MTFPAKKTVRAHRVAFAIDHKIMIEDLGPMPVHHNCSNRRCCNPDHLRQVTTEENLAEMFERTSYLKRIAELEAENALLRAQMPTF